MSIDCAKRPVDSSRRHSRHVFVAGKAALHPQQSSRERAPCGMNHRLIVNVEYLILIARNNKNFLFVCIFHKRRLSLFNYALPDEIFAEPLHVRRALSRLQVVSVNTNNEACFALLHD